MKPLVRGKAAFKGALDVTMSLLMLLLMSYALVGEELHEWLGLGMFAAFLLHHGLNASWRRALGRGRYTPLRTVMLAVNTLILLCVLGLMVSGVVLSRHLFASLPLRGGMALARTVHLLCSYWGFLLMAVHLGLHGRMIGGLLERRCGGRAEARWLFRISGAMTAGYGLYAFLKNDIASYLFLRTRFVRMDPSRPLWNFLLEYGAMAILFAWGTHLLVRLCQRDRDQI